MSRPPLPVEQISKAAVRKRAQRAMPLDGATCSRCGSKTSLDRHHHDYAKPTEVVILCRKCHREQDKTDGTWTMNWVKPRPCQICGTDFTPTKDRCKTLCGNPDCLVELGKRSAAKRWATGATASGSVATVSSHSAQPLPSPYLLGELES